MSTPSLTSISLIFDVEAVPIIVAAIGQETRKTDESIGFGQAIAGWFGGEVETIFRLSAEESSHFTRQ